MAVYTKTKADVDIASLKRKNKHFYITRSTSFTKLSYDNKTLTYADRNFGGIKGAHLSRMVRMDVDKLLPLSAVPRGAGVDIITHPPTVYVNTTSVDRSIEDYIYHIDIKNCYWTFAYRTGIISKLTWLQGLKKRDWKIGRNVSIGSLDKHETVEEWQGDELIDVERIHTPANYKYARLKVINAVNDLALEAIRSVLKEGFVMFLTDCFCIEGSYIKQLGEFLSDKGYEYTSAGIVIKKHLPERKQIVWDKVELAKKKETGQQFLIPDRDKFIHYTDKSLITI